MRLSCRARAATPSPTLALAAKVRAMKAAGEPVIGFTAGEPDFDTPEHIKDAARRALDQGFTKYCPAAGIPSLREAICERVAADQGLSYTPDQVVVSVGSKHSLYGLFQALLDPGDAAVVPAPYWVSYIDQIRIAGGVPIVLPTTEATGLKITPAQLEAALSTYPYARVLVLNSPSNPTGAVYSEAEIRALAEVVAGAPELLVISDDAYEYLLYDGAKHFGMAQLEAVRDRVVLANSTSKTYSMTGWRVGWLIAAKELASAVARIQSHDTSGTCSIAQVAAEAALRGDQSCVATMREAFAQRRRVMIDGLRALPGVTCTEPGGAFYAFPDVAGCLRPGEHSGGFCERLLEEAKVAVVPGKEFGAPTNLRLSYASSMADIEAGLSRLAKFVGG